MHYLYINKLYRISYTTQKKIDIIIIQQSAIMSIILIDKVYKTAKFFCLPNIKINFLFDGQYLKNCLTPKNLKLHPGEV